MSTKQLTNNESDEDLDALLELMRDIQCLDKLRPYTDRINIFYVLKIARTEIRHSNMLAWLLDPNESHGLGSSFLWAFITDLSKKHSYEFVAEDFDAIIPPQATIELLSSDLSISQVFREWNRIDILVKLPNDYVIAIENKVDASEGKRGGKSQLEGYSDVLKKNNYGSTKTIKVYLTPDGDKPSNGNDDWKVYTYSDIYSILQNVYSTHKDSLTIEAKLLIENYLEILKIEIMETDTLKQLCNEIYKKHKRAFDLIYEHRDSVTDMASSICFEKLKTICQGKTDFILPHDRKGIKIVFNTIKSKKLKEKISPIDVWYEYNFREFGDNGVSVSLTLVLHNPIKVDNREIEQIIKDISPKYKQKKSWTWGSIWSDTIKFNEIDDSQIGNWVKNTIRKIEEYEQKFLKCLK